MIFLSRSRDVGHTYHRLGASHLSSLDIRRRNRSSEPFKQAALTQLKQESEIRFRLSASAELRSFCLLRKVRWRATRTFLRWKQQFKLNLSHVRLIHLGSGDLNPSPVRQIRFKAVMLVNLIGKQYSTTVLKFISYSLHLYSENLDGVLAHGWGDVATDCIPSIVVFNWSNNDCRSWFDQLRLWPFSHLGKL